MSNHSKDGEDKSSRDDADESDSIERDEAAQPNNDLYDVMNLLVAEVERLKEALEFYRMSDVENKDTLVRQHVRQIDERQDRLDEVKRMIVTRQDGSVH